MTARVHELFKSRENTYSAKFGASSGVLLYIVKDAANEGAARSAAMSTAPLMWDSKIFRDIVTERIGPTKWLCKANYDDQEEDLDVGEWRMSFDTTGGTVRQTLALEERRYPGTTPDQKCAINVIDGKVQGIDVPVGSLKITVTFRMPRTTITIPYIRALAAVVGKTNAHAFIGFEPGELLFLGATGAQGTKVDPTIDFHFLCGENLTDITLGEITAITKGAHEHLWTMFRDAIDEESIVQMPEAVIVDRIHRSANFWTLAIEEEPEPEE